MTKAQAALLRQLIHARLQTPPDHSLARDWCLVEIGRIAGTDRRTAQALVNVGLAVWDWPSGAGEYTNPHLRLAEPDEVENFWKENQRNT